MATKVALKQAPKAPTRKDLANRVVELQKKIEGKKAVNYGGASPREIVSAEAKINGGEEKRHGFKNFTEFCHFAMRGSPGGQDANRGVVDKRLKWGVEKAGPDGMSETVGADGGFLVPPEFASQIMQRVYDNDLLSRCTGFTTGGNTLGIPAVDETSRADGSRFGGIQAYWDAEAQQATATKPRLSRVILTLSKLLALCYATDELLQDTGTALEQWLYNLFAQEITFKVGDAIVNGSGAGMPQGILNAPALITISKETGQAATTIVFENITNMWKRMWAPSRKSAVWLVHQDTEAQLMSLSLGIGTAGWPAYLPPGGLSDKPYGTIMGRPVLPVEFCATLGTAGDIILADLSQYLTLRKGEVQQDSSIHLKFDFAETAFRTIFRMDGKVWWTAALTPKNGTNTMSPFIALATRS